MFKTGKLEAKQDRRNFKMAALLKTEVIPDVYDFDAAFVSTLIPTPMFGNDIYGDCVIAGRAHQTIRFEMREQGAILNILVHEVVEQWHKENGNTDNGLYILDSIKLWRSEGWMVSGQHLHIKAFAQVNPKDHKEVKATIYNDLGLIIGLALPQSAIRDFEQDKAWTGITEAPNQFGGHCVYVCGYNPEGLTCITWGKRQFMSWDFFDKYCDEAYGTIDAANEQNINKEVLNELLEKVE